MVHPLVRLALELQLSPREVSYLVDLRPDVYAPLRPLLGYLFFRSCLGD